MPAAFFEERDKTLTGKGSINKSIVSSVCFLLQVIVRYFLVGINKGYHILVVFHGRLPILQYMQVCRLVQR